MMVFRRDRGRERYADLDARLQRVRDRLEDAYIAGQPDDEIRRQAEEELRESRRQGVPTFGYPFGIERGQKRYQGDFTDMIARLSGGRVRGPFCGIRVIVQGRGSHDLPHIVRHSQMGLTWGSMGPGAADAALSILVDLLGERGDDPELCSAFERDIIARAGPTSFLVTEPEIREWLAWREEQAARA
jgi:hypothetical protein